MSLFFDISDLLKFVKSEKKNSFFTLMYLFSEILSSFIVKKYVLQIISIIFILKKSMVFSFCTAYFVYVFFFGVVSSLASTLFMTLKQKYILYKLKEAYASWMSTQNFNIHHFFKKTDEKTLSHDRVLQKDLYNYCVFSIDNFQFFFKSLTDCIFSIYSLYVIYSSEQLNYVRWNLFILVHLYVYGISFVLSFLIGKVLLSMYYPKRLSAIVGISNLRSHLFSVFESMEQIFFYNGQQFEYDLSLNLFKKIIAKIWELNKVLIFQTFFSQGLEEFILFFCSFCLVLVNMYTFNFSLPIQLFFKVLEQQFSIFRFTCLFLLKIDSIGVFYTSRRRLDLLRKEVFFAKEKKDRYSFKKSDASTQELIVLKADIFSEDGKKKYFLKRKIVLPIEQTMLVGDAIKMHALFLALGKAWPCSSVAFSLPSSLKLVFVTEQIYFPKKQTLFSLIKYPCKSISENEFARIQELLNFFDLTYLIKELFVENKEWSEILSGGEKQRVNLIRYLYRDDIDKKIFIFENISVSLNADLEKKVYSFIKKNCPYYMSIGDPKLKKYHKDIVNITDSF